MTDFVTTSDSNQKKSTENKENKYVVLCETNEHESESWYYFKI